MAQLEVLEDDGKKGCSLDELPLRGGQMLDTAEIAFQPGGMFFAPLRCTGALVQIRQCEKFDVTKLL